MTTPLVATPPSAPEQQATPILPTSPTEPTPPDAPDAPPASAADDRLADIIARLRDSTSQPAEPAPEIPEQAPPPADIQSAIPVSAPPISPQLPPAVAPKGDMTRPGYRDHYGGLNSDGDVPPH